MRRCLPLLLLAFATHAEAALYCVASAGEFHDALAAAAVSLEADEIRLQRATLDLAADLDAGVKIEGDLELRGGYAAGCAARASETHVTRIDGNEYSARLLMRGASDLLVERMDFRGLRYFTISDNIAEPPGAPYGQIIVTRSAFRDFVQGPSLQLLRHDARVANSLFTGNSYGISLMAFHNAELQRSSELVLVNSTVVGNRRGVLVNEGSIGTGSTPPAILNTIAADNPVADLALFQPAIVRYSVFGVLQLGVGGELHIKSRENLRGSPMLDAKLQPLPGSPVIDSGDDLAVSVTLDPRDYGGRTRRVGGRVDRGAYEVQAGGPTLPNFP
jgi:hypothetical protein